MKSIFRMVLIFALLLYYNNLFPNTKDSIPIITVESDITALNETPSIRFPNIESKYFFITITLTNTQDSIVLFRIMTCSWSNSFVTDNDSIIIRPQQCDKNFPITFEIKPHKSIKFFGELHSSKKSSKINPPVNFKVGFADLSYKDLWNSFSIPTKNKMQDHKIYWSNSITLVSKLDSYKIQE